ncbi:hypothetical protein KI387_012613 [Taxus chinensis]|uniref:Protein kinase domain-containing protein n=1 Tax=Taxus chinensis TaxID=29808 RepID=A0AA38FG75_TAXCH|nr:hypothetical protein KI387_012613 [Taxus chinensis]
MMTTKGYGSNRLTIEGTLSNGRQVVIKRSRKRTGELVKELVCIANLQHRNILKLVGFCTTGVELLLVYDYMPNGNLSDLLFNPTQNLVLEWSTRRKIIDGVISAIVYLHDGADVSIVHRDIKPTNVLLDQNFDAKVSDFGIARTLHNRKSAPIGGTNEGMAALDGDTDCSTAAAGTVGYVAPECLVTGHVTKKADIFSFGLLVLNLVSGKRCLEFTDLDDGMYNLIDQAFKFHTENRLMELIDPGLVEMGDLDRKKILNIMKTVLWCIQTDPNLRPSASRLSAMLLSETEIRPPLEQMVNNYNSSPPDSPKASVELDGPR